MDTLPQTFKEFRKHVDQLLNRHMNPGAIANRRSHLRVLAPSARHLANEAENSKVFQTLAKTMLASKTSPIRAASALLRRGGFYHGVLARRSTDRLWCAIKPYIVPRNVQLRELVLLDGCRFPFRQFSILDWTIKRFSQNEVRRFGPPPQIRESFYPRETLNEHWFSQQWFLYRSRTRKENPGALVLLRDYDLIQAHWKPLLALSLYNPARFAIPIIMESERNWKLRHIVSGSPMIDTLNDEYGTEVPVSFYAIPEDDARRFKSFIRFVESGSKTLEEAKFVKAAARRYIRAMFIMGPGPFDHFTIDEYEDALLQYVYAMEKILLASGETEGIADKIAIRCAYLISLDKDNLRKQIYDQVKSIYRQRSSIVHGTASTNSQLSLDVVRDILRKLLVASFSFRMSFSNDGDWQEALRYLPVSARLQDAAIKASRTPLSLLR